MDDQCLAWYLVIKTLNQKDKEHVKTFDALMKTCRSSKKACLIIAEEVRREFFGYIIRTQYVWRQALDGWGGYYNAQWRITDYEPKQDEVDALGNSDGWIHRRSIKDVLSIKDGQSIYKHLKKQNESDNSDQK